MVSIRIIKLSRQSHLVSKCWILLYLHCALFSSTLFGQDYQGITPPYDISSGLPHNEINDIVKDQQGFIWIATENGLSRFDGFNFINFNHSTHPSVFKTNRILKIQRRGAKLYLLTAGDGLIQLQPKTIAFKKLYRSNPVALTYSNDTTAILFDTGTLLFKVKSKTIFTLKFNVFDVSSLIIYKGKLIISLNNKKVVRIDPKTPFKRKIIPISDDGQSGNLCKSKKYGLILWNGDIVRILKNNVFVEHPEFVGKKMISYFFEESSGRNMYIEKNRVPILNFYNHTFAFRFGGRENIQFKSIYRINETCFLIATNQGVVKILQTPGLSKQIDDFSFLNGDQIIVRRRILEHKNKRYYLGFPYILEQDGQSLNRLTFQNLSSYDGVFFKDELFCTTEGKGLISVHLNSRKIRFHGSTSHQLNESFESIARFSDSLLLLAGGNKLIVYNPETKRDFSYFLRKGIVIHEVVPLKNTNLVYLATNKGLKCIRMNSQFGFEEVASDDKSGCDIRDILIRPHTNEIWTATNKGVYVFAMNSLKIRKKFTKEREVSHPMVVSLLEDKNKNIWASTYSGLIVYNTNNGTIHFVNRQQGVINTEFNYKSACLLGNGELIFGGLNAFERINPSLLNEDGYVSSFVISGIETIQNEQKKSFSTYNKTESISFNTGKEAVKIYLANLDFQYGQGYSFQYTIDSKNWFKTDKKNWILLSNLSYGHYFLKIRMFDPFGQLVKEKSFQLYAKAPFYVKTGFYMLIIFLIIILSILLVLFFKRSIRIKAETKTKIAMDLHDESGTILTRLLMISKKDKFEAKEKEHLQNGLTEALYNFRTYLDSISRVKHSWVDLVDELQEFVKASCSEAGITVDFNVQFDKDYSLRGELFRDVKLAIYEIVTNTIKHAKADHISLSFHLKNKNLEIKISDNGTCNINDLNAMKGNGIRNIKKRITRNHGKYLYYISEGMSGLTIEINLPV